MKPSLAKLRAGAQPKPPAESGPYGIAWLVEFRFLDREWYRDRGETDRVVDAFAGARWWGELQSLGRQHLAGARFTSPDEVKDALGTGEPGVVSAGRGEPEAARWHESPDAALKLDVEPGVLTIMFQLARGSFERHADAALTDVIDGVLALADGWRGRARLAYGVGFPDPPDRIAFARARPPRTALRRLDAVVDIVDPELPPELVHEAQVDDARAIGTTPTPPGVQRIERGGVIALRWVGDPADRDAMARACAAHERWIAPLVHSEIRTGWNEAGDLQVVIGNRSAGKAEPFSFLDPTDRVAYLEVTVGAGGEVDEAAWAAAAAAARKGVLSNGGKLQGAAVVAQDRAAALRIAERAGAGGLRALYRQGELIWDPFPPGNWSTEATGP